MTRLKHREPATDLPSTPFSPQSSSTLAPPIEKVSQPPEIQPLEKQTTEKAPANKEPSSDKLSAEESLSKAIKSEALVGEISSDGEISQKKKGGWRRFAGTILRYPNVAQVLLFLVVMGGTSLVLLCLLFKGAWSDRDNNLKVINTILKMELQREDARMLETSPERIVTHTFKTLEPHVEADGWTWVNRFGNTITYGKQEQRMIASCRPYSPLYMICDLGEIPN